MRNGISRDWTTMQSSGAEQTREAGAGFAVLLKPGDVVALHGELGSPITVPRAM